MTDDVKQRRTNDSLQGGEGNPALGEDERDFGAGRQKGQRPLDPGHKDSRDRELGRDPTVPGDEEAAHERSE